MIFLKFWLLVVLSSDEIITSFDTRKQCNDSIPAYQKKYPGKELKCMPRDIE